MKSILLALVLGSANAFACSCMEMDNAKEWFKDANTIFIGTATRDSRSAGRLDGEPAVVTEFLVREGIKNVSRRDRVVVMSVRGDGANCGANWRRGEGPVLVFSYLHRGRLITDMCSVADPLTMSNRAFLTGLRRLARP